MVVPWGVPWWCNGGGVPRGVPRGRGSGDGLPADDNDKWVNGRERDGNGRDWKREKGAVRGVVLIVVVKILM